MARLGETTDPVALVPGRPASVRSDASALTARAEQLESAADALAAVRVPGWQGLAADAFWEVMNAQPRSWRTTADALTSAASRLVAYADVLTTAQADAATAIDLWEAAEAATAEAVRRYEATVDAYDRAQTPYAPPPFVDAGAAGRREAQALLDDARAAVRREGDHAADVLGEIVVADTAVVHSSATWEGPGASGESSGPTFEIDPTTGKVTLRLVTAEGEAYLFRGEATSEARYGAWSANAGASTMLGTKGEIKIGLEDDQMEAGLSGSIGLHADAEARAGHEHASVGVEASGLAGAYAEAGVTAGKDGVSATAGAFAGAKGEIGADAEVAGIGVGASAEGWAGAGAEAGVTAGRNPDGSWTVGANAGVAWGLGGGGSVTITVDPEGIVDAVEDAGDFIGSLLD